jgi:hypothetical protein
MAQKIPGNDDLWVNSLMVGNSQYVLSESELQLIDQASNATAIGAVNASVTGSLACAIERFGSFFKLTFTLAALRITVTDGTVSGSHGATKLFDFAEGSIAFLGSRANYTAFVEGSALTTAAGDANFVIGLGTTAISAAADKTLGTTTGVNVGASLELTNSDGTSAGTKHTGPLDIGVVDGTGTAGTLNLNWSGSAATIDATSTIDVTGTISVIGVFMGDD